MLRVSAGSSGAYCDGMSRRSFVQIGVAGHLMLTGRDEKLGVRPMGNYPSIGSIASKGRPVTVGDLHATIYHVLGVDPRTHFLDCSGRPIAGLDEGAVISELF